MRIDLALAHAPRDDLGVLRTEIENDNAGMCVFLHGRLIVDLPAEEGDSPVHPGNYVALAGKSAFKLLAHFLGGRRILGASDHADEEGEEGEGFHLEM